MLLFLTALTLGAAHAVAPDHLAAVGVFVSRSASPREAFRHGAHWGFGHALTLTAAGLAVLFVAKEWPQLWSLRAEWLVGVVLIVLGVRTMWQAWRGRRADGHATGTSSRTPHADDGGHAHPPADGHHHSLLGIGMLHGVAGSGAMAAIVPMSAGQSPWQAAVWMALFGLGTIAAMAMIAGVAGWSLRLSARRSVRAMRVVVALAGLTSVAVGAFWLSGTSLA